MRDGKHVLEGIDNRGLDKVIGMGVMLVLKLDHRLLTINQVRVFVLPH